VLAPVRRLLRLAPPRPGWLAWLLVMLRIVLTVTVLSAAYFLLPPQGDGEPDPWRFVLQLVVFGVVGAIQLPAIVRSRYPVVRAVEALLLVVALFLFIFSRVYLEMSTYDSATFSEPLDSISSLYFTVSVFATVGFGDIAPESGGARLVVTLQMLLNLVIVGGGIKLLASAARRGVSRRRDSEDPGAAG
jgi:voltage-gated potassium channel